MLHLEYRNVNMHCVCPYGCLNVEIFFVDGVHTGWYVHAEILSCGSCEY